MFLAQKKASALRNNSSTPSVSGIDQASYIFNLKQQFEVYHSITFISRFTQEVTSQILRIPASESIQIKQDLQEQQSFNLFNCIQTNFAFRFLLKKDGFSSLISDQTNYMAKKLLILREDIAKNALPEAIKLLLQKPDIEIFEDTIKVNYTQTSNQQILKQIIPESCNIQINSEMVKHIKLLEIHPSLEKFQYKIAEVNLDKSSANCTIIAEKNQVNTQEDEILQYFGMFKCSYLFSEKELDKDPAFENQKSLPLQMKENQTNFKFSLANVEYENSFQEVRNQLVSSMVHSGDIVCDLLGNIFFDLRIVNERLANLISYQGVRTQEYVKEYRDNLKLNSINQESLKLFTQQDGKYQEFLKRLFSKYYFKCIPSLLLVPEVLENLQFIAQFVGISKKLEIEIPESEEVFITTIHFFFVQGKSDRILSEFIIEKLNRIVAEKLISDEQIDLFQGRHVLLTQDLSLTFCGKNLYSVSIGLTHEILAFQHKVFDQIIYEGTQSQQIDSPSQQQKLN